MSDQIAKEAIIKAACAGSFCAYEQARMHFGINFWDLVTAEAAFVVEVCEDGMKRPKLALHTQALVEHNAEALARAFKEKFPDG